MTFITFIKRFLVILISIIVVLLVVYSCSAINGVSNYTLPINEVIDRTYTSEKQDAVLIFYSETEAYLSDSKEKGVYEVTVKNNLIYLSKEKEDTKHILVPLSNAKIMWQNKNIYLYYLEDAKV